MRINRQRELITLLGGAVATSVAWPLASRAQRGDKLPTSAGVAVMPREADLIAAEITPRGGKEREVARALQAMDFRVHAVGATISVDAPRGRWKAVFAARFAPVHRRREKRRTPGAAAPVAFQIPAALEPLVESVVFVEPPELL
jgi:hypothetical protein